MNIIPNFSFETNVSLEGYTTKKEASLCLSKKGATLIGRNKMAFTQVSLTVDDFLLYATSGHAFCNLFDYDPNRKYWFSNSDGQKYLSYPVYHNGPNKGAMKLAVKSDLFFKGAQAVYVDVDYTKYTAIPDYLSTLTYQPTCVYMSYSDGIAKPRGKEDVVSRRFRLVYVLDQVYGRDDLRRISQSLGDQIVIDTAEPMEDDCGERPCQYMNGVYGNPETYKSDIIYSVWDFPQAVDPPVPAGSVPSTPPTGVTFNENMLRDMESMSYQDFMHHYSLQYRYVYRTERPGEWIANMYQFTDENYLQLYFYLEIQVDGQNRRRKLFKNACLRRLMYPDIDQDTLLFNLYVDRHRFFDNSDGVITLDTLKRKVTHAMEMTPEQLSAYCSREIAKYKEERPRFIVMPGIRTDRGMLSSIAKAIRWTEIDNAYDRSVSLQENMERLDIPMSTLYRYCDERGIDTRPGAPQTERERREARRIARKADIELFKETYDPNLSLRKNLDCLEKAGLKMSIWRIVDWKQEYYESAQHQQQVFTPITLGPDPFANWTANPADYGISPSDWDSPAVTEELQPITSPWGPAPTFSWMFS